MAAIILAQGSDECIFLPLGRRTVNIGRDTAADMQVEDDRCSRKHVQIRRREDSCYVLADMQSANGTSINGRRVTTETVLEDGDVITIGTTSLVFSNTVPKDAANALEIHKSAAQRHRSTITDRR